MDWWVWLLIVLGVLLLLGLIVFVVIRLMKPAPKPVPLIDTAQARADFQAELARREATEAQRLASSYALAAEVERRALRPRQIQ